MVIAHRPEVPDFVATYPEQTFDFSKTPFVQVVAANGQSTIAHALPRRGASGNEILLSKGRLADVTDGSWVTVNKSSSMSFTGYRLIHSASKLTAFIGFLVTGTATVILGAATVLYGVAGIPPILEAIVIALQVGGLAAGFFGVLYSP